MKNRLYLAFAFFLFLTTQSCGVISETALVSLGFGEATEEIYPEYSTNGYEDNKLSTYNHFQGTVHKLNNGKILVVGGQNSGTSAEIYDPASETWSLTGPHVNGPRVQHASVILNDGRVAVFGGIIFNPGSGNLYSSASSTVTRTVEIYDPTTNTWSSGANMSVPRVAHSATVITIGSKAGHVLITGGSSNMPPTGITSNTCLTSAEIFNPTAGIFVATTSRSEPSCYHQTLTSPTGKIHHFAGVIRFNRSTSTIRANSETFDPVVEAWNTDFNTTLDRSYKSFGYNSNTGEAFIFGGLANDATWVNNTSNGINRLNLDSGSITYLGSLPITGRAYSSVIYLPQENKYLIIGGLSSAGVFLSTVLKYDPVSNTTQTMANLPFPQVLGQAVLDDNGNVLVFNSVSSFSNMNATNSSAYKRVLTYITAQNAWSNFDSDYKFNIISQPVKLDDNRFYFISQTTSGTSTNNAVASVDNLGQNISDTYISGISTNSTLLFKHGSNRVMIFENNLSYKSSAINFSNTVNYNSNLLLSGGLHTFSGQSVVTMPNGEVGIMEHGADYDDFSGDLGTVVNKFRVINVSTSFFDCELGSHAKTRTSLLPIATNQILVTGGIRINEANSSDFFSYQDVFRLQINTNSTCTITLLAPMLTVRQLHETIQLNTNEVLVVGGRDSTDTRLKSAEIYNLQTNLWQTAGEMSVARSSPILYKLSSGAILVLGGAANATDNEIIEMYLPEKNEWRIVGRTTQGSAFGKSIMKPDGTILLFGGGDSFATNYQILRPVYDSVQLNVTGGVPPYTYEVVEGQSLINQIMGNLFQPVNSGAVKIKVTDAVGESSFKDLTIW